MQKIILKKSKTLYKPNNVQLFKGENNVDSLEIYIPQTYNGIDLSTCNVRLKYILSDGSDNSFLIDEYKQDNLYKEQIVYLIPIDTRFTSVSGKIEICFTITKPEESNPILKSTSTYIYINEQPEGTTEITEEELDIIDQVVLISNKALKTAESIEQRADNLEQINADLVEDVNQLKGDLTQLDTRLSESITEINNGFVRITEIAKNLAVGGLTNGIYNPSLQYRVSSSIPEDALSKDTTVIIEEGRRLGVQIVGDDGTFISDSGFKTGYYVIPKEKKFMLCISATSSSSTEERQIKADVRTFESYLKVKSNIEEKFEKNDFEHSEINSILMPVSDKVFRLMGAEVDIPLTWKQGTITSSGAEGSNTQGNRIKTEFIDFSDYGIAEIKKNSGFEIKIFQYDSEGNYIKSPFDFVDSPTSESTSITIDEVKGKLYRFLLRVSSANESIKPTTIGGGILAVGKLSGEVDLMKREIDNIKDELSIVSAKPLSESFIELIAHRGGSNDGFYHNTLENVLACKKNGYSIIEFDVRETSDGVMVSVHDEVLTTYDESETITIANVTYDYLKSKQFFADPSIRIPTVIEIVDKCKQYGLSMLIDIKIISDSNIEYLHRHLKILHMDDKAMFASFSQGVLSRMRTHFANAPVFLNFSDEPTGDILESTTYKPIRDMIDAGKTALAFSKYLNFTDEYYNRLREYGFYVQIWTVANGDYKRFLGVADYLTTEEVRPWQLFE